MKQKELKDLVYMLNYFKMNGIKIKASGCGCCGSPSVKIEINDKIRVDDSDFCIDMFEDNPIEWVDLDVFSPPEESVGDHQKRMHDIKKQALIDGGYWETSQ